jgi:hypothetical protein
MCAKNKPEIRRQRYGEPRDFLIMLKIFEKIPRGLERRAQETAQDLYVARSAYVVASALLKSAFSGIISDA